MCRHAAYLGPPRLLARDLLDAPHSLHHQSFAPRELLVGSVNADGFGVAWYAPDIAPGAALYRSTLPIWADASFASVARHTRSGVWVANVRNGTDPGTTALTNTHPFADGPWSFSHNGFLGGFRTGAMRRLRAGLSDAQYAHIAGCTDSETLFRLVLTRIEAGSDAPRALGSVLGEASEVAEEQQTVAQLNVLLSDGSTVWATRLANQPRTNSLYVCERDTADGTERFVASEPFDEGAGWQAVEPGSLVRMDADGIVVTRFPASS